MKDDLASLMELGSLSKFAVSGEVDFMSESRKVTDEHVALLDRLEEVKGVVVENAVLEVLSTLHQEFLILPCHWAVVAEL